MPIVEPPSFNALNLVPFQINPHFIDFPLPDETVETRVDRINEFLAVNPGVYVAGMRDGTMLRVDAGSIKVEGSGRVCIFVKDQTPIDFAPGDSLQWRRASVPVSQISQPVAAPVPTPPAPPNPSPGTSAASI
jgi:dipeptidase E